MGQTGDRRYELDGKRGIARAGDRLYNYIPDGVALTLNRLVGYLESQGVEVLVFAPIADRPAFRHQGTVVRSPSLCPDGRNTAWRWGWPAT